ncbi:MAG: class I SAM-dependent methyltransferase [Candidatus Undinarchaeales archaeon]|jgi:ubiquinone/menaquinone biosynthesis C-methylase UbiE|nr:class I SAM-dependent methyltransferase [Candidatus Undinarchaeales archaeon]
MISGYGLAPWDKFFDSALSDVSKKRLVLDVGGGTPFQKEMSQFRDRFRNSHYVSLDYCAEFKPNIVGDICQLPFADGIVDAIICKAVLEHVPEPQIAVKEMYRVLSNGGIIFVYVPFIHPYHGSKDYCDYYRYTKDGLHYLFRDFKIMDIVPVRYYFETLSSFLPRPLSSMMRPFTRLADLVIRRKGITSGFYLLASK